MNRFDKLIKIAEDFYRKATWSYFMSKTAAEGYHMPDDSEQDESESSLTDTNSILAAADNLSYDIVNENLLTQFETLIKTYKAYLKALELNPEDFAKNPNESAEDTSEDAGELIDALNTRYERINSNPYLSLPPDDPKYEESFPAYKLLNIVRAIVTDAENKLKAMVKDDDLSMEEVRAAQQAKEFNQIMFDRGDKNLTVTGDKVKQLNDARKRTFEKLMFIKRVGKTHPDYARYENLLLRKKEEFARIKSDPERYSKYRIESNKRQAEHIKFDERLSDAENRLSHTRDPEEQEKLKTLINKIKNSKMGRGKKLVEIADRIREKKQSKKLDGLVIHLSQKLASLKGDTKKLIKAKFKKDPTLKIIRDEINAAEQNFNLDPSQINKSILEEKKRKEYDFVKNHSLMIKIETDLKKLYQFRDSCNKILVPDNTLTEGIQSHIYKTVANGEELFTIYDQEYKGISTTLQEIINYLKMETI